VTSVIMIMIIVLRTEDEGAADADHGNTEAKEDTYNPFC